MPDYGPLLKCTMIGGIADGASQSFPRNVPAAAVFTVTEEGETRAHIYTRDRKDPHVFRFWQSMAPEEIQIFFNKLKTNDQD